MKYPTRGFTLIELLVVLSIGAFLTTLAIGALERALSIDTATKARLDEARNLNRLSDQFRGDIQIATDVSLVDQSQAKIQSTSGVVTYSVKPNHVHRSEVMSDGTKRNERYSLGENRIVLFSKLDEPNRTVLTVRCNTGLQHSPTRIERVVAAVTGRKLFAYAQAGDAP